MAKGHIVIIVALGVFVLLAGMILPTAISSTGENATTGLQLDEGETTTVTDGLEATAVSTADNQSEIQLRDVETQQVINKTITEGDTATYEFSNRDTVTVTVEDSQSQTVYLSPIEYPRSYGWGDGAKMFADNIGLLLVILTFLLFGSVLIAVVEL